MKTIQIITLNLLIIMATISSKAQTSGKYAEVNGIKMYYEIHGSGSPLVMLHGGGSTIYTSFGRIIPELAKTHKIIAVELQAHGHTGDRNAPETFVQDAADVIELLKQLNIPKADFLGFSNGGHTTLEIAIKYPANVRKAIIASAFYKKDGVFPGFWDGFATAKLSNMPQTYQDEFMKINHNQAALQNMFEKDVQRMENFKEWTDDDIRSIQAPTLVVIGDHDVPTPEHAVKMYRLLQHGQLAILPGAHGQYFGEILFYKPSNPAPVAFISLVNNFLAMP